MGKFCNYLEFAVFNKAHRVADTRGTVGGGLEEEGGVSSLMQAVSEKVGKRQEDKSQDVLNLKPLQRRPRARARARERK